jgi:arylsulfatase A-like enzyme
MKTATLKHRMAAIAIASAVLATAPLGFAVDPPKHINNIIIFVADGLRAGSVNAHDAPEMDRLQNEGVRFSNSHSLFPTVTTANASAIATGHALGDTGNFGNELYLGCAVLGAELPNTATPFQSVEDDLVIRNLNKHSKLDGNYLGEESLLGWASRNGCQTAAIGKLGPVLIQDVTQNNTNQLGRVPWTTIIIDDETGTSNGVPLNPSIVKSLLRAGLGTNAPDRANGFANSADRRANSYRGNNRLPGTLAPNIDQQRFFADALTKVVLPQFAVSHAPFVIVYWSRDPDGTQHNQGDSLNNMDQGINGPTSKAAIGNCDSNLAQIREALRSLDLASNTDIFITADHGFDTVSKHTVDASGKVTQSYSTTVKYYDSGGRQEVNTGYLPPGFFAIDLAHFFRMPLYDPDRINGTAGHYMPVVPTQRSRPNKTVQHPLVGNGLIGGTGRIPTNDTQAPDATVVVMANGGADFIYIPDDSSATNTGLVTGIVNFLTAQDYVSGIFVNDGYAKSGKFPGALLFSDINLWGSAGLPKPAIIVNFTSFTTDANDPLQHGVIVADTELQQGQGNHGGFDRAATLNFMAAYGPDFKRQYIDPAPVSNADIAMTLAQLLGFKFMPHGALTGRVMEEALWEGPPLDTNSILVGISRSEARHGVQTILNWQEYRGHRYFDAAGFSGRTLGLAGD